MKPETCCTQYTLTSTGLTLDHKSHVLGNYKRNGLVNDKPSYKKENADLHLFVSPLGNWMVSYE